MTAWTVVLFDGRTATIDADEITTRPDCSLWLLRQAGPPPEKLEVVAVLAASLWASCYPCDSAIDWYERPAGARFAAQ
jgi:hypothetical protein